MLKQTPFVRSLVLKLHSAEDCENSDTAQEKNCDGTPEKYIIVILYLVPYVSIDFNLIVSFM